MRTAYFILPAVILCLLSCAAPVSPADSPIPSGVREVELGIQALEGGMWEEAYQHISSAREAYLSMPTPFWNWEHTRLLGVAGAAPSCPLPPPSPSLPPPSQSPPSSAPPV